jgi:hypothetical protein
MTLQRMRDLAGRQDEAAGCMDDQLDGVVWVGELDGPQHVFRVVHVDVAHHRKAEKLIVSCRCTSAITRLCRFRSNRCSRRNRLASSIFCRKTGCSAEIMKNNTRCH